MRPTSTTWIATALLSLAGANAGASPNGLVISQIYGGGGNSGATFRNDFIELFNAGNAPVSLDGYTVQYNSATGTGAWQVTPLNGTLAPGRYYLVLESAGAGGTTALPTPEASGNIAMSGTAGKVVLSSATVALSGARPASPAIVDLVGYGTADYYEGSAPSSGLSNTLADFRAAAGCTDTDSNSADFTAASPAPRNGATAAVACSAAPPPPVDPAPVKVRIRDIQGRTHRSPLEGKAVDAVPGIVTAVRSTGFYIEDPLPDADPATSEGIFVFTGSAPTVAVGQYVLVAGSVAEFRPGGTAGATNLTTTEIVTPTVVGGGAPPAALPLPVVIGRGGRAPPTARIAGTAPTGSVEAADYGFNAVANGIDFYESLEGMRVVVNNAVAVGPTNANAEIPVVGDGGSFATERSARGGVVIKANDFNPERIVLDDALIPPGTMPKVNVGDLLGQVGGVMDYSFGNFKLLVTAAPVRQIGPIAPEVTSLMAGAGRLTVASFNVENLAPANGAPKFDALARQIVANLRAPDILALMEVQDNNGATSGTVVDASVTLQTLVDAIRAAGGPAYAYRQIDPVADQDGGEPGGNIRPVFLFNPARVSFVDRPSAAPSTTPVTAVALPLGVRLSASPGRIAPTNPAFNSSRKPLVGEFVFGGRTLFLIANHFNSKGGDNPLFGRFQPPALASETQRNTQATLVADFVSSLRRADAQAAVIVLGDLNDFEFSRPLGILKGAGLVDLVETLPSNERYTYVFEGNSQVLDHILVSENLRSATEYDVIHINAEFAAQSSDHDPEVVRIQLGRADYTGQISASSSALVFNRVTGLFNGTISITHKSGAAIAGPLLVALSGLNPDVVLQGGSGTYQGMPAVALNGGIAAGATVTVPVTFANPKRVTVTYGVRLFAGPFQP